MTTSKPQPSRLPGGRAKIEATAGKPPRVEILAYNGGELRVEGFELPVIVDLAGLEYDQVCPILIDHDESVDGVLGQTTSVTVDPSTGRIEASGTAHGVSQRAVAVRAMSKAGHAWQASIGAVIDDRKDIPAGQTVEVNGRTFVGPVTVARRASLREISFVASGADMRTEARIAAKSAAGAMTMPTFAEWVQSLGFDPATLSDVQMKAMTELYVKQGGDPESVKPPAQTQAGAGTDETVSAAAFRSPLRPAVRQTIPTNTHQQSRIRMMAAARPELADQAVREGWDENRFELEVIRASRPSGQFTMPHSGFRPAADPQQTLEACLMIRAGKEKLAETTYGATVMESTRRIRARSFLDLCEVALENERMNVPKGRNEMLRAAFSTVSLPTALSNTLGRTLWEAYKDAPSTWRSFAKIDSAANFKVQTGIRPSAMGTLSELGPTGEVPHGVLKEEDTYSWSIKTYSEILKVSRTTVINDDLSLLDTVPALQGKAAIRTLNDLVWSVIMANAGSFFSVGNGNYIEGSDSALTLASLKALVTAMMKQRDADGNDLDIVPRTLVVPPELNITARNVLNSDLIQAAEGDAMGNALKNIVNLEVESRLSNTTKKDQLGNASFPNASTTGFFLFGSPADAPVIVGFLDGQERPTVEQFGLSDDPDHLGFSFRVVHDFGCALGDKRAAGKSKGAA